MLMKTNTSSLFAIYCYMQLLAVIPFFDLYTPDTLRDAVDSIQIVRGDYMFIDSIIPVQKSFMKSFKGSMYTDLKPIGFNSVSTFINFFHFLIMLVFIVFIKLIFVMVSKISVVKSRDKLQKLVTKVNEFLN